MLARLLVVLAAVLLAACGGGPPEDEVRKALQAQLDSALDGRVLTVSRFTRAGSAPMLREGDGRIVHFNAQLTLDRDYDFTKWDAHNVASLAAVVGAGPKGIVGLKEGGNRKGDTLGVYGSAAFVREGSSWRQLAVALPADTAEPQRVPAATVSAVQPGPREVPPATPLEQSLAQLDTLLKSTVHSTVGTVERDAIVREELESAMTAVRRRLDQAVSLIVLAAGPEDGAYAETAAALAARAREAHVAFAILDSQGSVENVRLLGERKAQFALVQNDVARNAQLGRGRFAGAPQELRAVASLFPEPVQLVAREGGGVASVTDLKASESTWARTARARGPTRSPCSLRTGSAWMRSRKPRRCRSRKRWPRLARASSTRSSPPCTRPAVRCNAPSRQRRWCWCRSDRRGICSTPASSRSRCRRGPMRARRGRCRRWRRRRCWSRGPTSRRPRSRR